MKTSYSFYSENEELTMSELIALLENSIREILDPENQYEDGDILEPSITVIEKYSDI